METLAIIPARGGSKGVSRKNARLLAGKPLVAHTICQAFAARHINRVVVSTDDSEIETISVKYGAQVIKRPIGISGDDAPSEDALLHVIKELRKIESYSPDLIVFLQCTSPLTISGDIDGVIQTLLDEKADTALTVIPFHYFLWKFDDNNNAVGVNHDKAVRLLRQKQKPQFLETGSVYVMKTSGFLKNRHRFFGKTAMYSIPPERCLEIDEIADFHTAEILMRKSQKLEIKKKLPRSPHALILDFDGVFTDNQVIVFQDGQEAVFCNRSDGMGLSKIKQLNLRILVISSEKNPVVQMRCKKLGIECFQGVEEKLMALRNWMKKNNIKPEHCIYLGNDINDISCMEAVGCSVSVRDAYPAVKNASSIILENPGGKGAIRELCDMIQEEIAYK